MNPLIREKLERLLLSKPSETFGYAYPTMKRYLEKGNYPAELCKKVETHTDGVITAVMLRPDIFTATPAMKVLASCCVDRFNKCIDNDDHDLMVTTLNYIENQVPDLYIKTLGEIKQLEGGELFVNQRITSKQYEIK